MIKFLFQRPIAVLMAFTACFIIGLVTYSTLPISLLPNIAIPEITIQVSAANTSARELENTIVKPLRSQLIQVSTLKDIHSESRDGAGIIRLSFDFGTNTDQAFIEVNEKIDAAMNYLPKETERPKVIKASATDIPVFYLNLTLKNDSAYSITGQQSFLDLCEFAESVIKRRIEQLEEVAMVDVTGLVERQVQIVPDEDMLSMLGISIEDIRSIISGKVTLQETLERQNEILNSQITDLNKAKRMCEKMLGEESISYEKLQVEQYVTELQDYWKDNQTVFKLDSVSFLYIWGSMLTWITITVLCLIIGTLSYSKLPTEIPVQWSKGVATSLVNINWIFICPVICIIIRYLLKPFIYAKLQMNNYYGEIITEYLTNYMCFIVLSVEIFSILFTFGVVKSVVVLLFVDTAIFIGLLVVGLVKMDLRGKEVL